MLERLGTLALPAAAQRLGGELVPVPTMQLHPGETGPMSHRTVTRILVDSPHRLELVLDPARGPFTATWPSMPPFIAGVEETIASLHSPG